MVHKLFEDFLDSAEKYKACEQYWERLVRDIEDSLGETGDWQQWIPRHNPNGTHVEKDGNRLTTTSNISERPASIPMTRR